MAIYHFSMHQFYVLKKFLEQIIKKGERMIKGYFFGASLHFKLMMSGMCCTKK